MHLGTAGPLPPGRRASQAASDAFYLHRRPAISLNGAVSPVFRTTFDVAAYTREARGKLEVDDGAIIRAATASPGSAISEVSELRRDLEFLHRVESGALTETRTMYSAWTVNEARITAFIATWLWERHWWASALRQLSRALAASEEQREGAPRAVSTLPPPRLVAALRRVYVQRALPAVGVGWTWLAGEKVTAGHMARMAIQEGSLQAAVRALLPRTVHLPEVHRVLSELAERRTPALSFFRLEAIARITRSPGEANAARLVLATGGDPMRPAGQPVADEDAALGSIFRHPADRSAMRAARFEITRLLPGPDPYRSLLPRKRHRLFASCAPAVTKSGVPVGF